MALCVSLHSFPAQFLVIFCLYIRRFASMNVPSSSARLASSMSSLVKSKELFLASFTWLHCPPGLGKDGVVRRMECDFWWLKIPWSRICLWGYGFVNKVGLKVLLCVSFCPFCWLGAINFYLVVMSALPYDVLMMWSSRKLLVGVHFSICTES